MPLPPHCRVKSFLGCISLQRGCIILGLIGLFDSLRDIIDQIQWLVDIEFHAKQCHRKDGNDGGLNEMNSSLKNSSEYYTPASRQTECPSDSYVSRIRFIMGFGIFTYFILFMMTLMMVYGVQKKIPKLMTPWLVWQFAQIFFILFRVLGMGFLNGPRGFSLILEVTLMIYFILVVSSYYAELKEAEARHDGVTIVAVTQTPYEMRVVIPTHMKDDPPPPYPGLTSVCNPAYNFPSNDVPVHSQNSTSTSPPPPYQASDNTHLTQASHVPLPGSTAMHSNINTPPNASGGSNEAAPLMDKSPLPNS